MQPPKILNGYEQWGGDEPFENHTGPFFFKRDPNGKHISAFICAPQHLNGNNALHGGLLMAFADYALFVVALDALADEPSVTISCTTEFLKGAAPLERPVFSDGEVTRATRSLVFVRGRIFITDDNAPTSPATILASYSGILKRITNTQSGGRI